MSFEVIRFVIDADWDDVNNFFSDKKISETFKNEFESLSDLVPILIEEYRNQLLSNSENKNLKSIIQADERTILSELKPILKAQILATALNECVKNGYFDLKKEILQMMQPINMIVILQRAIEETFNSLINDAFFEAKDAHNIELMS